MANTYVTLTELQQAQTDFNAHYYDQQGRNIPAGIAIDWTDLYNTVQTVIGNNNITEDNLLFRFIHRYENGYTYITLQCCTISNPRQNHIGTTTWTVTDKDVFFKILNNAPIGNDVKPGNYPYDYALNFYYSIDGGVTLVKLATDDPNNATYVSSVLIPWKMEIVKLCFDNGLCDAHGAPNYQGIALLKISGASFQYPQPNPDANIEWPHTHVLYMNYNGNDLVSNQGSNTSFANLAADMGTLCPPNCPIYIQPANL